jgi:hypothetical protein
MEFLDRRVEFDPIARRQQHRLIDGRRGDNIVDQLARRISGQRGPFE